MLVLDCDRSGTYYVAAEIPSNCTNNYINIVTNLVDCMSNYSCGHACVYGACPYTETVSSSVFNSKSKN
jgi:predicted double-glycine peptidase